MSTCAPARMLDMPCDSLVHSGILGKSVLGVPLVVRVHSSFWSFSIKIDVLAQETQRTPACPSVYLHRQGAIYDINSFAIVAGFVLGRTKLTFSSDHTRTGYC